MRKIPVLLLLLCIGLQAQAQKSVLWRIEKDGHPMSFVFGTMHLICQPDFRWRDVWERRMKTCQTVCFELDLSNGDAMSQASAWFIDKKGKALGSYFEPGDYALVRDYMQQHFGMPLDSTTPLKPLGLESLLLSKTACDSTVFYEEFIRKRAQANGLKICGLEKPEEQFRALESLSTDSVVREIMRFVRDPQAAQAGFQRLTAAYKAEDVDSIQAIAVQEGLTPSSVGPMLVQRNKTWIPRMIARMNEGSVFFAVGAAHLGGEQGLINLLTEQGYRVTMVLQGGK